MALTRNSNTHLLRATSEDFLQLTQALGTEVIVLAASSRRMDQISRPVLPLRIRALKSRRRLFVIAVGAPNGHGKN